jgi:hypothetical protein
VRHSAGGFNSPLSQLTGPSEHSAGLSESGSMESGCLVLVLMLRKR